MEVHADESMVENISKAFGPCFLLAISAPKSPTHGERNGCINMALSMTSGVRLVLSLFRFLQRTLWT